MKRILFLVPILLGFIGKIAGQNVFDPADPIVRYISTAQYGTAAKPDTNVAGLQKWVAATTNGVSTGSGAFKTLSETYKAYFINFFNTRLAIRIKFPKSFGNPDSVNKKYPIALFMHGAGEVGCVSNGGIYNNEKQLVLGGNVFGQRVENNLFDGFLVYPQLRSKDAGCWGEWGSGPNPNYNTIITFIDSMAKYVRADIDRVFVYGLSGGGIATWELAENYPQRIAKIAPTSAAGTPLNWPALIHIPIWLATGGKDTNPSPDMALYTETNINNYGGSIRRSLYADLGHSSWDRHWAEPDFVNYMNDVHKANPLIFYNRFEFCPDSAVSARLGITAGFYDYEWIKDGDSARIATSYGIGNPANNQRTNTVLNSAVVSSMAAGGNEITIKTFGTYHVRFRRSPGGAWSAWSRKPAVIKPKTVTQTPPIQIIGTASRVLPALDGKTKVQLQLPEGFINYQWVRTTDNVVVNNAQIYDAPVGTYKARYSEPFGCGTEYSPVFKVVNAAGTPKPDAAKNLSVSALSQSVLRLDWADNPNAGTNETGFEIYRATKAAGPWSLIRITAPNSVNFQDSALTPNTVYYYMVRAISETGAAAASNTDSARTEIDNVAPTAPLDLEYRGSTSTTVTLRWKAATDNVAISRYDIYGNGQKMYSTPNLSFTVASLDSLTSYTFYVKAVDKAGNQSPNSNQIIGYTHRQGLNYKYYHGSYGTLPNFNNLTPVKTGVMDTVNAGAGVRTQDDNFAFLWEGLIYIPVTGTWTFETSSDDGSKLYIDVPYSVNATALVDNNGAHAVQSRTGSRYLTQGYHTIAISYAEVTGAAEEMNVFWSNNAGLARERTPKGFYTVGDNFSEVAPVAPSDFLATPTAFNKIQLSWNDNSLNETGFEIVRGTAISGPFTAVATAGANKVSFTDSGLAAGTKYFYKIRSVSAEGESPYVSGFQEANWRFNNNFNEENGGTAATGSNAPFSTDRPEGSNSVNFNSSSSFVAIGGGSAFPSLGGYNQRTVALWIKPAVTTGKRMVFDIGGNDNGLGLRFNGDALIAGVASGSSRSTISLSNFATNENWLAGQFNHVAVVYEVNTLKLYLNGVQVATNATAFGFTSIAGNSSSASRLGQINSNSNANSVFNDATYTTYSGLMDNMFIFRSALSQADIVKLKDNNSFPQSFATTLAAPAAPSIPANVSATVLSTHAIELKFDDNSTDETGFEVWRSSGDKTNNRKIATISPKSGGQISYIDSTLFANTTYYFTIRATGVTANSAFSPEVNGQTLNTLPFITKQLDFTMRYATTYTLPVKAVDPDGEVLTFVVRNLPVFATMQNTGNGLMNITFNPTVRQRGAFKMTVVVQDANGGADSTRFTLTVNDNDVPVMAPVPETLTINEGAQTTIAVSATDNTGPATMTWSFTDLPSFVTFTNNNNGTGSLLVKPGFSAAGEYFTTITVNDGYGAWTSRSITITVIDKDADETVQFDFRSSSTPVAGWNNVAITPPGFSHGAVNNIKGNLSDIAISLTKGSVALATNGAQTGNNSGVFPDAVMKDMLIWGFNTGNNLSDTINITVSGLDPGRTYNMTFHSSYTANGLVRFSVGTQAVSGNYVNNTLGLTLTNLQPSPAGEVIVVIAGDANIQRGATLSAMVIKANFDDGTTPAKPTNFTGIHTVSDGVKLNWADKAYNETAYQVFRSTSRPGPYTLLNPGATNKDSVQYFDVTVAPQTTYYYYIAGVNAVGMGASSDTIQVITGNNKPVIAMAANAYVKAESTQNLDFTATDDPGDVVTVQLTQKPNFVTLQDLGGSNYRLVIAPVTDHIGTYTIQVKATDDKNAQTFRNLSLIVSDKNTRSVFVNFGSASKTAPAPWNNWLGVKANGAVLTNIRDEKNDLTPFTVTATAAWTQVNDLGHLTGNNSGVVPDSVLQSCIVDNAAPKTFSIAGLDNTKKYNVVFVGSMNEGPNALVEYSSGTTLDTLNARYNTNQTANLNGLTPVGGVITVSLRRINPSDVNYLNAMVIEEYDASIAILNPLNLFAEPNDRTSIDLSWSDRTVDEDPVQGYVLERATDSLFTLNLTTIGLPANTTTYRNTGLSANTKYWYRVRARSAGALMSDYSNRAKAVTPASIVYVDFNYTLPDADFPWNSTFASPTIGGAVFDNLTNQAGANSGLSLELTRIFNGEFTAGVNTGNNSGVAPDKALASNYWLDKTQLSQFRLSGMNHARRYRIGFFGSASSNGWFKGNYTATYTINGRTVYLNSWMNSSKIVYIDNVQPDETGSVLLDFSTTDAAMYGFNAGIVIQDYSDPQAGSGMLGGNLVLSPSTLAPEETATGNAAARGAVEQTGRLYPNPFTDFVNMDFYNKSADNTISVEVYDIAGRLGYRKSFGKLSAGSNTVRISASDAGMRTGIYIITLSVDGKAVQASKVIRTQK